MIQMYVSAVVGYYLCFLMMVFVALPADMHRHQMDGSPYRIGSTSWRCFEVNVRHDLEPVPTVVPKKHHGPGYKDCSMAC